MHGVYLSFSSRRGLSTHTSAPSFPSCARRASLLLQDSNTSQVSISYIHPFAQPQTIDMCATYMKTPLFIPSSSLLLLHWPRTRSPRPCGPPSSLHTHTHTHTQLLQQQQHDKHDEAEAAVEDEKKKEAQRFIEKQTAAASAGAVAGQGREGGRLRGKVGREGGCGAR